MSNTAPLTGTNQGTITNPVYGPINGQNVDAQSINELGQALVDNDVTLETKKLDKAGGTIAGNLVVTGTLQVDGNTTLGNAGGDTTTIQGTLTLSTAGAYPVFSDSYTRIFPHTIIADDETEWTIPTLVGGVTRDGRKEVNTPLTTPNSGRFIFVRIEGIPAGANITGAYVWLKAGAGHGSLPAVMPNALLQRQDITAGSASSGSVANDASGTVGAYEATHSIHVTSGFNNWNPTADMLYLVFQSEYGTGGVAGLEFYTVQLEITIAKLGK